MSENININNNIRNDINPENIETIDFDALESTSAPTSAPKAEVDSPSIEEIKKDSAEVGEIDKDDSIDSDDSDDLIDPVSPRSNLVDLNLIGELQEGEVKYLQIGEACIEVKSKLPYKKLFEVIEWVLAQLIDTRTYLSYPLQRILTDIAIVKFYTNLDLSEMDLVTYDVNKTYGIYDLITQYKILDKVLQFIDSSQIKFIENGILDTAKGIIAYRNSAAGILDILTSKEQTTENGLENLLQEIQDPDTLQTINNLLKAAEEIQPK